MRNEIGSLGGKAILIIDDAMDARLLARKILEGDGASVSEADTIDAGIAAVRAHLPHLIVVDLNLPGKTGFDFLDFRMGESLFRVIPTIVLSALKDKASVQNALSMGADDYILKPFRATLVLQKVRKALRLGSFYKKQIVSGVASRAVFSIAGEVLRMNEVGCAVECPVKFSPEEGIALKGALIDHMDLGSLKMRTDLEVPKFLGPGRYSTEINFAGIDRDLATAIARRLKSK